MNKTHSFTFSVISKHSGIKIKKIFLLLFLLISNTFFSTFTSAESKRIYDFSVYIGMGKDIHNFLEYESNFTERSFSDTNKFLTPDTISQSLENKYVKFLSEDEFKGGRTARWYYAWVIFKEYPWYKKLFGGGFDYLEMFGKKFGGKKYDYPHNPFVSAFLYSGIIGGGIFVWYIFLVFYYYIKYYKYHLFFLVCFLVVFFFCFFSSNSFFSVPIYMILSIIPFLTRSIIKNEHKNL